MTSDRLKRALQGFISATMSNVDYLAHYPAKVIGQNADGSLELQPDDPRLPTLSRVPLRLGLPGVTVKVAPGSRVLLFFESGRPDGPAASIWQTSSLQEITVTASTKVTVNAPEVDLGDGHAAVVRYGDAVTLAPTGLSPLAAAGGLAVAGIAVLTAGLPNVANPVPTKVKA